MEFSVTRGDPANPLFPAVSVSPLVLDARPSLGPSVLASRDRRLLTVQLRELLLEVDGTRQQIGLADQLANLLEAIRRG